MQNIRSGKLKGGITLADLRLDVEIISKCSLKKGSEGLDWINLLKPSGFFTYHKV